MNNQPQRLEPKCGARHPDEYRCTEPEGHQGDHVAEGMHGPIVTWPQNGLTAARIPLDEV